MSVGVVHQRPVAQFSEPQSKKFQAYIDRKIEARSGIVKAIAQSVEKPNSGSRLNKRARINSENDLGLAAIEYFMSQGHSAEEVESFLTNPTQHQQVWKKFRTSKQALAAANEFDYQYTHLSEVRNPLLKVLVGLSRVTRQIGDLLVTRTSSMTRMARSAMGSNKKITLLTMPLYVLSAMLTNGASVAFRQAAKDAFLTATNLMGMLWTVSGLSAVANRILVDYLGKKELTNNDLKIAQYRALEILGNVAKTAKALPEMDSTHRKAALDYAKEYVDYSEKTLCTRLTRLVKGDCRGRGGFTAKGCKLLAIDNLAGQLSGGATVGDAYRAMVRTLDTNTGSSMLSAPRKAKAIKYTMLGIKAFSLMSCSGTSDLQASTVPGYDYGGQTRFTRWLDKVRYGDQLPEHIVKRRAEHIDHQFLDYLVAGAKSLKKSTTMGLAKAVAVQPLSVSSKSVEGGVIAKNRQAFARWLSMDIKNTTGEVKNAFHFNSPKRKLENQSQHLDYAVKHIEQYGPVSRCLLKIATGCDYLAWKILQPLTGNTARAIDKHVLKGLRFEKGYMTRSHFASAAAGGAWTGLNFLDYTPTGIIFGGLGLLKIVSTTALGVTFGIPASLAYGLAQISICFDWNRKRYA